MAWLELVGMQMSQVSGGHSQDLMEEIGRFQGKSQHELGATFGEMVGDLWNSGRQRKMKNQAHVMYIDGCVRI